MNGALENYYFFIPLLVFGPLFLLILYNFGLREIIKMPGEMRRKRLDDRDEAERVHKEHDRKRGRGLAGTGSGVNKTPLGLFAQGVTYVWFAFVIGFFASSPPYGFSTPDTAQIKLSLSHPGQRKVECRRRTQEELAKLQPNMRAPADCPRERWPVFVEIAIDDKTVMRESAKPNGLSGDGPSIFYRVFRIKAGSHRMTLRLRDKGKQGFGYETTQRIELAPMQSLAVVFNKGKGGFIVK